MSATATPVAEPFRAAPVGFIENRGQAPRPIRYYARNGSYGVYLEPGEARFNSAHRNGLSLRFVGARPDAQIEGRRPAVTKVNFAYGNDPSRWHNGVATFDEVAYRDLWPGIDLVFRRSAERLKYDFIVHPGGDPSAIRLAWSGARRLSVDRNGNLNVHTASGTITDERPYSYQEIGGKESAVESRFRLRGRAYGFAVGAYDRRLPLVIDPGLEFSTFLGGNSTDFARAIALDPAGNIYVAGDTSSSDFPVTPDAFDGSLAVRGINPDAFVAKLDPTGSTLLYATFLGGTSSDAAHSMAVDGGGNVYVAGNTFPPPASDPIPFPTTANAFDNLANGQDVFVARLTPAGTLAYSTFFGGTGSDSLFGINNGLAADDAGNVWVAGHTESLSSNPANRLPVTGDAFDPTPNGGFSDGFLARFDTNKSGAASLAYSSFFGGSGSDNVDAIVRGPGSTVYLLSTTNSSNMPTTAGAYDTTYNDPVTPNFQDFHVAILDPSRSGTAALMMGTYLGGRGPDFASALALDAAGNIYVAGFTNSPFYPTTENAYDRGGEGDIASGGIAQDASSDAVFTKLNPEGSALLYSTYLSSCADDSVADLAVDDAGNVYVLGRTGSGFFPTTLGAYDRSYNGSAGDVFLTKVNTNLSGVNSLVYSTLLGGNNLDQVGSLTVDRFGQVYLAGTTASRDFPVTPEAFDTTFSHPVIVGTDAFVAKFDLSPMMQLQSIAEELLALAQEILNRGQAHALYEKLEAARAQLERGNTQAAAGQIRSFIHQVQAFVAAGALTIQEGERLVDAANRILAQL